MRTGEAPSARRGASLRPVRMQRIALTAGRDDLRETLVRTGMAGCVEIDSTEPVATRPGSQTSDIRDPVESYADSAARRGGSAALVGWCPAEDVPRLAAGLGAVGGALVRLKRPRGVDPPTMLRETGRAHRSFSPLVRGYGTVPYADMDPTLLAGFSYVVMFGLMFGDVGHGALVLAGALILRSGRIRALNRIRRMWPFVAAAGATATVAGLLYGECFGPTGLVPTLWINPMDEPMTLLAAAIALGAVLIAVSYGVGIVNRWREAGARTAFYAVSGIAGAAVFTGAALLVAGFLLHSGPVEIVGAVLAVAGLATAGIGLAAQAPAGGTGAFQVGVELFDLVTRIGSNVISFARIAAFGLTHAALGAVIWQGTTGLAHRGPLGVAGAVLLFAVGNALAFALEGLVVCVQAMRLEYYELFSRIFDPEGRPFRPFRLTPKPPEVAP